jgi:hypothetical protein
LQETKRGLFDSSYLRNFCPRHLSKFKYFLSDGASGGLITIWNHALFDGSLVSTNAYSITVKLTCALNGNSFCLSNIYGPAAASERAAFITWLYNFYTSDFDDWLLAIDFNLIRSPANRNKEGGNQQDMLLFNDLIQHLDLVEIEFRGKDFTWSNMQQDPLLEKLDWVFTSSSWATSYPDTSVKVLSRPVSGHTPFMVIIGTHVLKARLFCFENY